MWKSDTAALYGHLFIDGGLPQGKLVKHMTQRFFNVFPNPNPPLFSENMDLPGADRREPKVIRRALQFFRNAFRKPLRLGRTPQDDVRIEQEIQCFKTSHSFSSTTGDTISPVIFILPFKQPSQVFDLGGGGGMTSAMGSPFRVMRMEFPVFLTLSRSRRHVALNFEMGMVFSMGFLRIVL